MEFLTRGNSDPKGKPRVYISFLGSDRAYFDALAEDILACCDCALFYSAEDTTREEHAAQLQHMQLMVVAVTGRLLAGGNRCVDVELPLATGAGIPILPIVVEEGLVKKFSQVFGQRQYLDKTQTDTTAIPYERKLAGFLGDVLVGSDLADKIRAAFDAYIFLSYRKKDRKYAQELMGLIHSIPDCRDVAIWYDEYLIPGEDFNHAIARALEKCDVFALAVTPNLLQPGNYVLENEYPEAVRSGKPILAAELVSTDRTKLEENYEGIPATVDAYEPEALAAALRSRLRSIVLAENDHEPGHMFFIGLAYLNGIDVEVDREKALELIRKAALAGLPEAAKKLASMYRNGEGVPRDGYMADLWLEHYSDLLRPSFVTDPEKKGDALYGFLCCLSYGKYFMEDRGSWEEFSALKSWRAGAKSKLGLHYRQVLEYINARWERCDVLRKLGAEEAARKEDRLTGMLAGLLHRECDDPEVTACYVNSCIRGGGVFPKAYWKAFDELVEGTEQRKLQLEFLLAAAERDLDLQYLAKEREGYYRRAKALLTMLAPELEPRELALLNIRLYHGMGRGARRGYSYSRRFDNGKNHRLLQKAYDLALEQLNAGENARVLAQLREICASRANCCNASRKATEWLRCAVAHGRRLYELTRLVEDLDRLRELTQLLLKKLDRGGAEDEARECARQLALLGEGIGEEKRPGYAIRRLLKTCYTAACEAEGDQGLHWYRIGERLFRDHSYMLNDGDSLRMGGLCSLRLGHVDTAAPLLEKAWTGFADEEACAALVECGVMKYERRAILFAAWMPDADLEALAQRARKAGLTDVEAALRGQPTDRNDLLLQWHEQKEADPELACDYLVEAALRLSGGNKLPIAFDDGDDALVPVELSAMYLCAARMSEQQGQQEQAAEILEAACRQLRCILEETECANARRVLILGLEQLIPLLEKLGMLRTAKLKQELRTLLLEQAERTGDDAQLRRVLALALEQGTPRDREVAAALRLAHRTEREEDLLRLSRLASGAPLSGVEGGILAEQLILVQEQLLKRGFEEVKLQLAHSLERSVLDEKKDSVIARTRLERIAALLEPSMDELAASDAALLHRVWHQLGCDEKRLELERRVLEEASADEQRRRAVSFAVDLLEQDSGSSALLERAVAVAEKLLAGSDEHRDCLQITALYQLCARYAGGAWQEKADEMLRRLECRIDGIEDENTRLELLEGCGDILWMGGNHDSAEAWYVKLTDALQKRSHREVELNAYCDHCERMGLGFLGLGQTLRAKPWIEKLLAGRMALAERVPGQEAMDAFMFSAGEAAEAMPEKDRKYFYAWFGPFVKKAVALALEREQNPADDVAEIARCLLKPRYFLWAARLDLHFHEWSDAWWRLTCIPTAWYMKHFVLKPAKGGKKEGSL